MMKKTTRYWYPKSPIGKVMYLRSRLTDTEAHLLQITRERNEVVREVIQITSVAGY